MDIVQIDLVEEFENLKEDFVDFWVEVASEFKIFEVLHTDPQLQCLYDLSH